MNLHEQINQTGRQARGAAQDLIRLNARQKNGILTAMANELDAQTAAIQEANTKDMAAGEAVGLSEALLDRLLLTDARIESMSNGLRDIAALKDPVGEELSIWHRPNGLDIIKTRVPIGVVGIIYESRPNVTADAAGLCLKTSNAVILRGGKESIHSNTAIAKALCDGGRQKGMPEHAIQLIETTDRDAVTALIQCEKYVDMIIPRGGESLIRAIAANARVPVLKHYDGICHTYVDEHADPDMAVAIAVNAKCQRPGVCNAMETLLVHQAIAGSFLPAFQDALAGYDVELRGDDATCAILKGIQPATAEDWTTEYLDLTLSIRVVDSLDEAVDHINTYGSSHSDAIVSNNKGAQEAFTRDVDSATVYVNASTRFTDGGQFGMGAEMGISTDKLHARGPVGLEEMTTYKYIIQGKGQIRE